MSTPKSDYMLFFSGPDWDQGLSPEQLQCAMDRVTTWFDHLAQQGKIKAGHPLGQDRHIVTAKSSRLLSDGPFAESKEAIGGYLLLEAAGMEEAVKIAESCPTLQYGITIEVRSVADECPCFKRAKERLAIA
ncbi:MAG: YciI family protein [Limisphaerales bacterium]